MTSEKLRTGFQLAISIHIPRVGDDFVIRSVDVVVSISIHIPRVGDDDTSRM